MRIGIAMPDTLVVKIDDWRVRKALAEKTAPLSRTGAVNFILEMCLTESTPHGPLASFILDND